MHLLLSVRSLTYLFLPRGGFSDTSKPSNKSLQHLIVLFITGAHFSSSQVHRHECKDCFN